jgi:hypothetical protein
MTRRRKHNVRDWEGRRRKIEILLSTLIRAVSTLPLSSSVAISRRAVLAWASFFSCRVRRRWTDNLYLARSLTISFFVNEQGDVPQLNLKESRVRGTIDLRFMFVDSRTLALVELQLEGGISGDRQDNCISRLCAKSELVPNVNLQSEERPSAQGIQYK